MSMYKETNEGKETAVASPRRTRETHQTNQTVELTHPTITLSTEANHRRTELVESPTRSTAGVSFASPNETSPSLPVSFGAHARSCTRPLPSHHGIEPSSLLYHAFFLPRDLHAPFESLPETRRRASRSQLVAIIQEALDILDEDSFMDDAF